MNNNLLYHFGRYLVLLRTAFSRPEKLQMYWKETLRQMNDIGIGSLIIVALISVFMGAVAGYLVAQGHTSNFFSFVITHSAFELTGIVLSGAAGLRLGAALLAPGRLARVEALKQAASASVVLIYGATVMLLVAAALEAFWSSAQWVPHMVKYVVGGVCWALVLAYLVWQGRPRPAASVQHAS